MLVADARESELGRHPAPQSDSLSTTLTQADAEQAGPGNVSSPISLDWRAVWQMTAMCLGIGIFTIPYAFLQLGVAHATIWVLVMGYFANVAMQCLLDMAVLSGLGSYEEIAEEAFGGAGKVLMSIITMVTTGIASFSYLAAARSLLVGVAVAFFVDFDINSVGGGVLVLNTAKDCAMLLALCAAVLPRCTCRSMGGNAWISTGGTFAMCLSSAFFVYTCVHTLVGGCGSHCGVAPSAFAGGLSEVLQYIALLAFSFSMVFALFPVLEERLATCTVAEAAMQMKPVARMSVLVCCVVYLIVGLGGVFAFGSKTLPLALQNLPLSQLPGLLISLLVGVSTTLLVAIVSFPTIQSMELLAGRCWPGGTVPEAARPWFVAVLGLLSVVVDAFLPTRILFALTGSLGLAMGAYLMPCWLFLRLDTRPDQTASRWKARVVLLFGCVLLFGSTPLTIVELLKGESGPRPRELLELLCPHAMTEGGQVV